MDRPFDALISGKAATRKYDFWSKKEEIKVRFFDNSGWEKWAELGVSGIHHMYAINITVPRYMIIFLFLTEVISYHCIDICDNDLQ